MRFSAIIRHFVPPSPDRGKALGASADMVSDICTNSCKIFRNLQIRVAQNRKTLVLQVLVSYHICRLTRIIIMLRAIQFYYKLGFCTEKINDIIPDDLLPFKNDRLTF